MTRVKSLDQDVRLCGVISPIFKAESLFRVRFPLALTLALTRTLALALTLALPPGLYGPSHDREFAS